MFEYLRNLLTKQTKRDSDVIPRGYMLLTSPTFMAPLDIDAYLSGTKNPSLQSTLSISEAFFKTDRRNQTALYKIYASIEEMMRGIWGQKSSTHPQGKYILRLGYDQDTMLELIKQGRFHQGIVDALNASDVFRCYPHERFLDETFSLPPGFEAKIEVIKNPNFNPNLQPSPEQSITAHELSVAYP